MEDIIPITNQGSDLLANSRNVAKLFSVTHAHLREQIADHEDQLAQLGQLRVETEVVKGYQGGGNPSKCEESTIRTAISFIRDVHKLHR